MSSDQLSICIEGGGPYGFRLFGGDGDPLVIAKLRKKSKAWEAGLEEGDVLLSINDQSCRNISHAAAMNLMENSGHFLNLKILRKGSGGRGHLQVTRSGSRQRSLTPTHLQPALVNRSLSPASSSVPFHQQPVQWSPRVSSDGQPSALDGQFQKSSFNSSYGVEFQLNLPAPVEQRRVESSLSAKSVSPFATGLNDSKANKHSPSPFQERRFSPAPYQPNQPVEVTRAVVTSAKPVVNRSPAVWKPPSWQHPTDSSRTTTADDGLRPSSAKYDVKENVSPVARQNDVNTQTFHISSYAAGGSKPIAAWQPKVVPPHDSNSSFPVQSAKEFHSDQNRQQFEEDSAVDVFGKSFDLPPNLNKILTAVNDDDDDYDHFNQDKGKRKVFVDSSFYDDPGHRYPTVDEQIKMARNVALSLTAPDNSSARGHRMFMKRKATSDKWVVDTSKLDLGIRGSDTESDKYYNPTPWNAASAWVAPPSTGNYLRAGDIPVPPPLPTSKLFAPKLNPEDASGERSKALSAQEFERLRLYGQKTTHNAVSPQVCFDLAQDLRQSKGKGGRMFAKRRAKSEEWTIEGSAGPDPKLLQKISGGFSVGNETPIRAQAPAQPTPPRINGSETGPDIQPVNRLKEMLDLPKPKMTPWDAVAEYGNVDVAFEHLDGYSFLRPKSNPYAETVASSLHQATRKKSDFPSRTTFAPDVSPQPKAVPQNWNRPKETAATEVIRQNNVPNSGVGFSTFAGGAGYRPINFQFSPGNAFASEGGFSDL